jgi:alpha-beta hydrolase superfamily lysophospholipase
MESIFDSDAFTSTLFYPQPRVSKPPPGARDLAIDVAPDVRLHARLHEREKSVATVLLFHGNGEVVSDYDQAADDFAKAGVDLAVVDYRGYGASTGSPTLRHCLRDASVVVDAVLAATSGRPLIVMGRSLGSACAAELCQTARDGVIGYIVESGIADVAGIIRRRGIALTAPLPAEDLAAFDPLPKFARCVTPTLVLHGSDDTIIPPGEARMTFDALAAREKSLVVISGRGHNNVSLHPRYWDSIARFVARLIPVKGNYRWRSGG